MSKRVSGTLKQVELTLMDLNLVNIDYPKDFSAAIQDTELAKQESRTAEFAKTTAIIKAVTLTEQAQVFSDTLAFTAEKTGEASFLERSIYAYLLGYAVTTKGNAFIEAWNIFQSLAQNITADIDYDNDNLLTFVWLMALVDAEAGNVVLDAAQPFEFVDAQTDDKDGLELDANRYFEQMAAQQAAADVRALTDL